MAVRVRTREMNARIAVEQAERKVIEAAKAFAWSGMRSEYDARDKAEAALIRAVMALQEVE